MLKLEEVGCGMPQVDCSVRIREIVDGDFTEGSWVTVNVDGGIYRRKVFWDNNAKDLCITIHKQRYFYCEFWDRLIF